MKITQKTALFGMAIFFAMLGFFIDKKKCMTNKPLELTAQQMPLIKMNEPLIVHNTTGAKVNAAFYTKRLKRSGSVISLKDDKTSLKRRPQASLIAFSRNTNDLGLALKKSTYPRRINIRRVHCVDIKSNGHDLILKSTSNHKH